MSQLYKRISKQMSQSHKSLEDFTKIEDMPDVEPWNAIKKAYGSNRATEKILATVFNGINTEKKEEFLLSQSLLKKMFEADPNQSRHSINGTEFEKFMGQVLQNGIFEVVHHPSKFGSGERIAGTYRILDPELRELIGFPPVFSSAASSTPRSTAKTSNEYDNEVETTTETYTEHEPDSECEYELGANNHTKESMALPINNSGQDCNISNPSDTKGEECFRLKKEIDKNLEDLRRLRDAIYSGQRELIPSYRELHKFIDQKIERFNIIKPQNTWAKRRIVCVF